MRAPRRTYDKYYEQERLRMWKRRGIKVDSYQTYLDMKAAQLGICAICTIEVNGNGCLDHDHETGEPRGVLCNKCNKALGVLERNLQQAVNYLEAHERRNEPDPPKDMTGQERALYDDIERDLRWFSDNVISPDMKEME